MQGVTDITKDHPGYLSVVHAELIPGYTSIISIKGNEGISSLGGCRFKFYKGGIEEAAHVVTGLSDAMRKKATVSGLPLDGGKAIIIGNPDTTLPDVRKHLMFRFGEFVQHVNENHGKYITAEDGSTTTDDMVKIREATEYVVGLPQDHGGLGDPSPATAFGIFTGLQYLLNNVIQKDHVRIAVSGPGKVGRSLIKDYLAKDPRVEMVVVDKYARSLKGIEGKNITTLHDPSFEPDDADDHLPLIHLLEQGPFDLFVPNHLPSYLIDESIVPLLKQAGVKAIAGATNNVLGEDNTINLLAQEGILYIPDSFINQGGLVQVYYEWIRNKQSQSIEEALQLAHGHIEGNINEWMEQLVGEWTTTHRPTTQILEEIIKSQAA